MRGRGNSEPLYRKMMKIYVFSDSHRNNQPMVRVVTENRGDYDCIIHLGDHCGDTRVLEPILGITPLISIIGNNDYDIPDPFCAEEKQVTLAGQRFFLCHGHRQHVKSSLTPLLFAAKRCDCSIALFGHTHVPHCETIEGITLFNPGSIGAPCPLSRRPSYGVIQLDGDDIRFEIREVSL